MSSCDGEIIPDAMEEGTETKVVSPEYSIVNSAGSSTSVQHDQAPQPCSHSRLPSDSTVTVGASSVTADMDLDEDSSSGSEVDLSGCLTVQEFVESYSTMLPVNVIAIRNRIQRAYTIRCIEQTTVLRIEDKYFGKNFNVPIESGIRFGMVYNPNGSDREASHGYEFATISDILKLPRFPAVVAVTKDFSDHYSGSPTVKKHEVLIVRETSAQGTSSQRYLRVYSLLTNSTKDLPEQCAGHFSTNPSLISMCAADIIRYIIPQPFPCQAVMYIPSNNRDTQIPFNRSNIVTIADSRIENSLIASEVSDTTRTCIRIPLECSSKTTIIVPEVTHFEECNHTASGEVVYAQPKKKASQPAAIATGGCDYDIISEDISSSLAELDTQQSCKKGNISEKKKKHNPLAIFVQRALRRRHLTTKSKREPRPATQGDAACAVVRNPSYMPTRPLPREPYAAPIIFPNPCYGTGIGGNVFPYDVIPAGAASLQSATTGKETYTPNHHCPPEPSELTDSDTDPSGNDFDLYEPIPGPGAALLHHREAILSTANECKHENVLDNEICNYNGDEKCSGSSETADELASRPITPSSTYTQTSSSAQMSLSSEPSVVNTKSAANQHTIAKVIEQQLSCHREEILGRIQVFEDQLKSCGWLQEREGRLIQSPQEATNSESMLPRNSEYLASRDDFVAEDTNMQKIQSLFEQITNQVDTTYVEFRRRLDSFEQQLGQQQNRPYDYIDDTISDSRSHTKGQDLQKVHSMLDHLTVVTAQTEKSMSDYYVQFTKKLDSIELQLEQQKHPDCISKDTALEPLLDLCTLRDSASATLPKEKPPITQPQVEQHIDVMTELQKFEKQLMKRMESFERKLTEKQNLILKQLAEQKSPAFCCTHQTTSEGFQSAKPEPTVKEVARILNGFCRLYELGVQLDISVAALDQLDYDHGSNIGKYRIKVIEHWLKNTETPTWEALAQALKDIGEDGLARRIPGTRGYPL